MEIANFYTATVYNKGAELIRMLHTRLGPERFRAGSDLYFDRHDGQAVTCEDFVRAMEESSGEDLTHFRLWYEQAGTPRVKASLTAGDGVARLRLEQLVPPTPGQPVKRPMPIPLRVALFAKGSGEKVTKSLILLDEAEDEAVFESGPGEVVLSINRGFSAPVIVETERTAADLAFLSAHDDDPFARYEAMQQLMLDTLLAAIRSGRADHRP